MAAASCVRASSSSSSSVFGFTLYLKNPDQPLYLFTDNHEYLFTKKMGEGADGVVWQALLDEKHHVAVKMVPIVNKHGSKMQKFVENEFRLLRSFNHKNVVKLQGDGLIQAQHHFFTVMEWIDGKTLEAYRKEIVFETSRDPTEQLAAPLFSQMVAALKYVHEKHIVHLDLSLANFLIVDGKKIVLIDFGDGQWFPDDKASLLSEKPKSFGPRPPESLPLGNNPSTPAWNAYAADWWNLGVLTYGFLFDRHPFYTKEQCQEREKTVEFPPDCKLPKEQLRYVRNELVLQGLGSYRKLGPEYLTFPESVSPETRTFIRKLLSFKPEERRPL
jgi:serine/threonine protein kinase